MEQRTSLLSLLLCLASGCYSSVTLPADCAEDGPVALRIVGVQEALDGDRTLPGFDLDGEPSEVGLLAEEDYVDPDGTTGIDSAASSTSFHELGIGLTTFDDTLGGNRVELYFAFGTDDDGLCEGLAVGRSPDDLAAAEWSGMAYRAPIGTVPIHLTASGVVTTVSLQSAALRAEVVGGELGPIVIGGYISIEDLQRAAVAPLSPEEAAIDGGHYEVLFRLLADLDTDGDGYQDAVSFVFRTEREE